jgi:hypothetical protein
MASGAKSGCLGMLLKLFGVGGMPTEAGPLPYRLRDDFLSPAEVSFYHVLRQVAGERATVCAKVRLADVFFVARPNENAAARNRIAAKHVDFLLCDPATMRPLAGVELDDESHQRTDRVERDVFVEQVFAAAGLPLVRFPAQRGYALAEVAGRMSVVFGDGAHGEHPPTGEPAVSSGQGAAGNVGQETPNASPPLCPKCGIALVIRTGPRGNFCGCSNFPKCRETATVCI